jgi:AAA family ATP:ADP antiporter
VPEHTRLERLLSIVAPVKAGEGLTALLMMINLSLMMTAYYIIKPVREALILQTAGPEIRTYASVVGTLGFILLVPLYGTLARRLKRIRLINGVTAFFVSNLVFFYILGCLHIEFGVVFFLWVGLFNLIVVAQFWAFANDVYSEQQGKRLFAVIGIGSSLGSICGSGIAGRLFTVAGSFHLMLIAACLLCVCIVLTNWVHNRETRLSETSHADLRLKHDAGLLGIFKERYLLLIALLILLSNVVSTTGEFILGKSVADQANAVSAAVGNDPTIRQQYIGLFYANFYFWVNLVGAALQIFVVSRVMRTIGVGPALCCLPAIALGGYTALSFSPVLFLMRALKIVENGTHYSLQNTAHHALFLRTSREAKYIAKTAIDSLFWRAGDAVSALVVFVGTSLAFTLESFAKANALFALVWLCVSAGIVCIRVKGQ